MKHTPHGRQGFIAGDFTQKRFYLFLNAHICLLCHYPGAALRYPGNHPLGLLTGSPATGLPTLTRIATTITIAG
jgi:hypothetical protein